MSMNDIINKINGIEGADIGEILYRMGKAIMLFFANMPDWLRILFYIFLIFLGILMGRALWEKRYEWRKR